jgi:hypothetical protein
LAFVHLWQSGPVKAAWEIGGGWIEEINRVRAYGVGEERRPIHQIG